MGRNKPGSFFFVDRPAGSYVVTNLYWTGDGVSFMLDAGQTRYVRITAESLGSTSAVGQLSMQLVDPPELADQQVRLAAVLARLEWPQLTIDGYAARDLLATLAASLAAEPVAILSADRDFSLKLAFKFIASVLKPSFFST